MFCILQNATVHVLPGSTNKTVEVGKIDTRCANSDRPNSEYQCNRHTKSQYKLQIKVTHITGSVLHCSAFLARL
jgi:hypothetical protein